MAALQNTGKIFTRLINSVSDWDGISNDIATWMTNGTDGVEPTAPVSNAITVYLNKSGVEVATVIITIGAAIPT